MGNKQSAIGNQTMGNKQAALGFKQAALGFKQAEIDDRHRDLFTNFVERLRPSIECRYCCILAKKGKKMNKSHYYTCNDTIEHFNKIRHTIKNADEPASKSALSRLEDQLKLLK
jgi:hypothetical protein